jgi:beta-galactosidase
MRICIGSAGARVVIRWMSAVLLATLALSAAAASPQTRPEMGAQIWIEPGQTPAEIDGWFAQLESAHMPVARLFMMWTYLETAPGQWDFTLYDAAFRSAEKHHVRIVATLTPNGPPVFRGGNGSQGRDIVTTPEAAAVGSMYIAKVVDRYRSSPALDTWLLVNEPGQRPAASPLAVAAFRTWAARNFRTVAAMNEVWGTRFTAFSAVEPTSEERTWNHNRELDWRTFWEGFQTQQLKVLADEVRKSDAVHPLHLNPAGVSGNFADGSDDLPAWRSFLDTLGCSIHPAWHFALFPRDRYALGVSYTNDLVRGSAEPKPYWVTELQGGNTIYSGNVPMEPTPDDLAQWTWTSLGAGADRVIYWLLNARREGVEAGEWSMLDFAQKPSERLTTAAHIAEIVERESAFFAGAKPLPSSVTVVLSLQTMTFEEVFHQEDDPAIHRKEDPARGSNAHFLEAAGFYEALSSIGVPPNVKQFDDYDWKAVTPQRRIAILPDMREMSAAQIDALEAFVSHGNVLLISGLTGFYGPHAEAWPLAGFPLAKITGATLKEVHVRSAEPAISIDPTHPMPARLWLSTVTPQAAKAIAFDGGEAVATERSGVGGGSVLWIPSPIGSGAWLGDPEPLVQYLRTQILPKTRTPLFTMNQPGTSCLVRVLENHGNYATVVTNGGTQPMACAVLVPEGLKPTTLWGATPKVSKEQAVFDLGSRGTSVVLWR